MNKHSVRRRVIVLGAAAGVLVGIIGTQPAHAGCTTKYGNQLVADGGKNVVKTGATYVRCVD